LEDHEIVELLLRRDPEGVRAAQEKYGELLKRLAGRILFDPRDVEECVNDCFLRIWQVIPPNKPDSLGAFLNVVVRQNALDRRRRQTAEKRGGTEFDLSLDELEDCVGRTDNVSNIALTDALNRYLRTLSVPMRSAFLKRYFSAEPIKEIAKALSCSESKIKGMLFRCRKGLKKFLIREGFDV
jgi:RNA polymerase sigma-70 factor (ECF subfamily)